SYLSGLIDLSGSAISGTLQNALKLGHTGHAELVTANGLVIASTYPDVFLHPGEHQTFYRTNLTVQREKTIQSVYYEIEGIPTEEKHIMAVVPLSMGNWGVALGGDEGETLAPVTSLRRNLLVFGLLMLAATLGITLWGTGRVVRPVLLLTRRARAMAEGDLVTPIEIDADGEVGVLTNAFNEMRQRLLETRQKLTQSNVELEEKVRQRSQELAKLQAQVELERLKVEFISQVSHEFRTPLGLIKGYVTTLLRGDISTDEETRREFLTIAREETEKLEELVETLLDTSRMRAGTFTIDKKDVDLVSLFNRVIERARTRAERHSILCQEPIPLPVVRADAHRLEQVFDNLLDNALKYSRGGTVTISAQMEDGIVHFAVSDEGDSIPAEELGHIFEAFYRGQNPAVGKVKGSGLGLTICKGIVEAHGGNIWAESFPDRGNRFHFTLPLEHDDEEMSGFDSRR
ncbi:MAG: HAMP domain-containing protein, partial [Chloroflexi bacterium]|nr:HAMP domain-containing protein [Chloroflexota bacterium]